MNWHEFTIIASGLDPESEDFEDRFFEAGCDDSTIAFVKGRIVIEFSRNARNFSHALISAMRDVIRAGAIVEHVEPDYLVSLTDIAERCKMSKAAISLYARGERGAGFPAPVVRVTTQSPLWDWVEVAKWMHRRGTLSCANVVEAQLVRYVNCVVSKHKPIAISRFGLRLAAELEAGL